MAAAELEEEIAAVSNNLHLSATIIRVDLLAYRRKHAICTS